MKELYKWLLRRKAEVSIDKARAYTKKEEMFSNGQLAILNDVISYVKYLVEEEKK